MDDVTATYNFSKWIREERRNRNLTLRGLSRKIGTISHTAIADAENGKYSTETALALGRFFDKPDIQILEMAGYVKLLAKDRLREKIVHEVEKMPEEKQEVAIKLLRTLASE